MKLTKLNLKAIFVLTMLVLNIFVSASETIKLHKTLSKYEKRLHSSKTKTASSSHKSSSSNKNQVSKRAGSKTQLKIIDKLMAFLVGFITEAISQALKTKKDSVLTNKIKASVIDYCLEPAVAEFKEVREEYLKKKKKDIPCQTNIINELLGEMSSDSIQSECAMLSTIRELDDNKFSSLNVIFNKIDSGVTGKNEEWEKEYKFFKVKKQELETTANDLTDSYIATFKIYKNDKTLPDSKRQTATRLLDVMDGLFGKNDICKALNECNVLGVIDYLKILLTTSFGFFKCAAGAPFKALINYGIGSLIDLVGSLLKTVGLSAVTSVAKMVFPALLVPYVIKFIFDKFKLLKNISVYFFTMLSETPGHENDERDLWNMLGELSFSLLWMVVSRRRKMKKLKLRK